MVKNYLEMPGLVADQIDLADYVGYLQAPVGTGKVNLQNPNRW